ncbi:DUF2127 domain-containing protein [Shewanella livingstonensis]|uniref:DUF2127 domain-containing protein n=1 Tax=Shewanella livingstonensis TaxID=150120 RepID=A0A3G8LV51_9GAMM|nr:DUF2127 domain-containing protein [Shewanella livingstonensis]AZG73491.1 DUF2127 domain-containing protein [Shewanella livingstonensis]
MMHSDKGVRAVAVLEASKGILALMVAIGLHVYAGQNLSMLATQLVTHLHLNPASHYPSVFISAIGSVSQSSVILMALGAAIYTLIRFIEAYGLWHNMRWTQWFALLSGAIYLPFEVYEMMRHFSLLSVSVLAINLAVVVYMYRVLFSVRGSI